MEAVVTLLREQFAKSEAEAVHLMLTTHHKGAARVGNYPLDDAIALVERATESARGLGVPLRITVEREGAPLERFNGTGARSWWGG